jgi:hypothetical protein
MSEGETRTISSVEEAFQYIRDQLRASESEAKEWRALKQRFSSDEPRTAVALKKGAAGKAAPKAKLASAARTPKAGTAKPTGRSVSPVGDQIVSWLKNHPSSTRLDIEKGLGKKENSLFYHLSALKQKKRIKSQGKTFGTRYSAA